jgi:catechol 2,3-dioxygenase-like lactoylglutathione lyase family enzyme
MEKSMAQLKMNHLAIRSPDANATRDFFMKTLGLTVGPRPDFPFPGYWLYKESHNSYLNALIHIVEIDPNNPQGLIEYLGGKDIDTLHGTGAIDHVAFFATELENMLKHLNEIGVTYRERLVPTIKLHQVFLEDPNGITIELNYPAEERVALDEKMKTHAH